MRGTTVTTKSPILHFVTCGPTTPHFTKKDKNTVIWHVTPFTSIPVAAVDHKSSLVWARGAHDIATESHVTVQMYRFVHSDFVSRNWFKCL